LVDGSEEQPQVVVDVPDVHSDEEVATNCAVTLPDIVVTPPPDKDIPNVQEIVITPNNLAPPSPDIGQENEAFIHDSACCEVGISNLDHTGEDESIKYTSFEMDASDSGTDIELKRINISENTTESEIRMETKNSAKEIKCSDSEKKLVNSNVNQMEPCSSGVSSKCSNADKLIDNKTEHESDDPSDLPLRVKFNFSKYLSFQQSRGMPNSEQGTLTSPACDMA
jgi:hypothetical protein